MCGLVQSSRIIDETAEWRSFGGDGGDDGKADMNRVGGKTNPYLSNSGLDTSIKGNNSAMYAKWHQKG
jgi:transcription initiation factor TFIIIB Brf1 subunit/transcription initiation factor TFIIB